MEIDNNIVQELLFEYSKGQRCFKDLCIEEENLSLQDVDLSNISFENYILSINFQKSKLNNARFINCNIKSTDFSNADLTHVQIKSCLVDGTIFKGSKTTNLIFENNYFQGIELTQEDFKNFVDT